MKKHIFESTIISKTIINRLIAFNFDDICNTLRSECKHLLIKIITFVTKFSNVHLKVIAKRSTMLKSICGPIKSFVRRKHSDAVTKIGVLGVPFEKGQHQVGVADGPKYIRKGGLVKQLSGISDAIDVKDYGDITYDTDDQLLEKIPNMKQYEHVVSCTKAVSKSVESIINDGRICVTLGGDHSISVGTVDGHIKGKSENVAVLWIDAHADINTNKTSDSGNMHGMPLAILAKELSDYWPYLPGLDWQKPIISLRNLAYIGLRSVDPYEHLIIQKLGITAFDMFDIQRQGIDAVVHMALDKIDPYNNKSLHVSFDIDSLDSLEAPSTGTAVRGGLLLREGIHIMSSVHRTGRLGALDLVEVNPSIGDEKDIQTTVNAAISIILSAFGHNKRGLRGDVQELPLQTFPPKQGVI